MSREPFVSIVVPTYNRKGMLSSCLDSLAAQSYPKGKYEVIVVDDGSGDGTGEFLTGYAKGKSNFRFFIERNQGPSAARNLGIHNSKGEIVCFTDDDCIVDKDWILNLVDSFRVEKVGGSGGKVVSYETKSVVQRYADDRGTLDQEKFSSASFLITCNAAYRRTMLESAGGFDPFLNSCEDLDLSIKARLLGYELMYNPEAVVRHRHVYDLKGLMRQQYRNSIGFVRLHRKYPKNFSPAYDAIPILARLAFRIATYPLVVLGALFQRDRLYILARPLLDDVVSITNLAGIFSESFFGKAYKGEKVTRKLDFIEEKSIGALLKKKIFR